jgi:hypothetical protein
VALQTLSGDRLEGDRLVRVTYLDESGADPKDPLLVVAGIIVLGDNLLIPVENRLDEIKRKHIPAENWDGFFFHAVDIFSGGNKRCIFHDRDVWPEDRRFAILDDLARVPADFDLPIAVGVIERATFPAPADIAGHSPLEIAVAQHAMGIIQCAVGIELWMRQHAPSEITHLIAEDNNDVRLAAREAQVMLRDRRRMEREGISDHPVFPLERIRDGLMFAYKTESPALQVADFCSWAVRRAAKHADHAGRFYTPIRHQIIRGE